MKIIEIYDYDTKDTIMSLKTNKKKHIQKDVIDYLKKEGFNLLLQGKITPFSDAYLYWLAYNKNTGKTMKLWYREKEKYNIIEEEVEKEDVYEQL